MVSIYVVNVWIMAEFCVNELVICFVWFLSYTGWFRRDCVFEDWF